MNNDIGDIKQILSAVRHKVYSAMIEAYWKLGEKIVLQEQHGEIASSMPSKSDSPFWRST